MRSAYLAGRTAAGAAAAVALVFVVGTGCLLNVRGLLPAHSNDWVYECTMTLRHPDGAEVEVSSTDPLFSARSFFTCGEQCPPDPCDRDAVEDVTADWVGWVRYQVDIAVADPMGDTVFRLHGPGWCEVESECAHGAEDRLVEAPAACPSDLPLGYAGAPPPEWTCEPEPAVDCLDVDPELVSFTDLAVTHPDDIALARGGDPAAYADLVAREIIEVETVAVTNRCAAPVRVQIDNGVSEDPPQDFYRAADLNGCAPRDEVERAEGRELPPFVPDPAQPDVTDPAGRCTFEVAFHPAEPWSSTGHLQFWSSLEEQHRVDLSGYGLPGELSADPLCIDRASNPGTLKITNNGPGAVTITDLDIASDAGTFEILSPLAADLPLAFHGRGGDGIDVTISAAGGLIALPTDQLLITSNAVNSELTVELSVQEFCP